MTDRGEDGVCGIAVSDLEVAAPEMRVGFRSLRCGPRIMICRSDKSKMNLQGYEVPDAKTLQSQNCQTPNLA